ncbi:MAG: hypothetical protein CMI96_02575 [Pelagibacteraceae bacterium]|nr:hypothetical protein [Pelagibacteraceae bacterium]|tara:strand:- start:5755 stop:6747 length:993 start_codon:yes stop_codon:yes gene_type:complete
MIKKIIIIILILFSIAIFAYGGIGFYVAYSILKIDPTCGWHQNSLPNTWSTKVDSHEYSNFSRSRLRENFPSSKYHLEDWQDVYFSSREDDIMLNGWLFNYFPNRPIVIVVHGIFPNGKCKPESNLIASMLISKQINALTIDLRNYGESDTVSEYEDLGLKSFNDVLGAYDFLKNIGFEDYEIGLHGISLGAVPVIFASSVEQDIRAIWVDSSLAEFNMVLQDEIARYGLSIEFGPAVSFFGKLLTGVDPTKLNPVKKLTKKQAYFFTHGDKDQRMLTRHYNYFKNYTEKNNINANFWLAENSYHVDSMFKHTDEYADKMHKFFTKNLIK